MTPTLKSSDVSPLPFDIICEICASADNSSLHVLSLLNRACNHETNKYLWRRIVVKDVGELGIRKAAVMIARNSARALCIREITILLPMVKSPHVWNDIPGTLDYLCCALQYARNAKLLEVRADAYSSEMARALSSHKFLFKLQTFRTNLYCSDGLEGFLKAHPEISHLVLYQRRQRISAKLCPTLLPRLRAVACPPSYLTETVRDRPVEIISVDLRNSDDGCCLLNAIPGSTREVTEIRIPIHTSGMLQCTLDKLSLHVPKLTSLGLSLRNYSAYVEMERDMGAEILRPIRSMKSLRVVVWRGPLVPTQILQPDLYCCPTLRRIVVVRPGKGGYHVIERDNEFLPWRDRLTMERADMQRCTLLQGPSGCMTYISDFE